MSDANAGSVLSGNSAPNAVDGQGANQVANQGTGDAPQDWSASFSDDMRGMIQTKGWKSPADAINSYVNLERLLGADKAGRGVVLPKDDAPKEDWDQFYTKLGRPESPDKYNIKAPDGNTSEFGQAAAARFHELGITAKQAEGLTEWWNEYAGSHAQNSDAEFEQKSAIDVQDLRKAWGDKFDANAELARRARREAGLSEDEGVAIEKALGLKKAAEVFAFLGKQFAESPIKGGEGERASSFGATPADAKARIAALKNDTNWTAKYLNGDIDARQEFERLHRIAFPET